MHFRFLPICENLRNGGALLTTSGDYYRIRPSARLLSTIGEDIIKDVHAAIVELVKNAYDADATNVDIEFSTFILKKANGNGLKITVKDNGHGMSRDVIVNKWMVPATNDKLMRKYSPDGRLMQGRKGIGRYAAAILGDIMKLETVDINGQKTILKIDWRKVVSEEYLDDVKILIQSEEVNQASGTCFSMNGATQKLYEWNSSEIDKLVMELKKLMSPIMRDSEDFNVKLIFNEFPVEKYCNRVLDIEPIPLLELYDYRLSGTISSEGYANLVYENKTIVGLPAEPISTFAKTNSNEKYCGLLKIDFRVFDRDPDSIQNLINKGMQDPITGRYLGKNETKRLLNEICGVSIYRGNFRIRPYGDPGSDWLSLDEKRVQNPSMRIGRNQIYGFVIIETEEESNLEEKSARDGLKENAHYKGLLSIVEQILVELQSRRFAFRKKTGLGRKTIKINTELQNFFDLSGMSQRIEQVLSASAVDNEKIDEVRKVINQVELEKSKELENITNQIAIYQGQATLGKIIMVLMHEGRKPLSWFINQASLFPHYAEKLQKRYELKTLEKIVGIMQDAKYNTDILIRLFDRLEPLAVKKRGRSQKLNIKDVINKTISVFEGEFERYGITVDLDCGSKVIYYGWAEDFFTALTNLMENSIYWLSNSSKPSKKIEIKVIFDEQSLTIDFFDNGPGIKKEFIENDIIFEPEFSTKSDNTGTGLGLAIAGEAIERSKGKLKALYYEDGAYFRIDFSQNKEVKE